MSTAATTPTTNANVYSALMSAASVFEKSSPCDYAAALKELGAVSSDPDATAVRKMTAGIRSPAELALITRHIALSRIESDRKEADRQLTLLTRAVQFDTGIRRHIVRQAAKPEIEGLEYSDVHDVKIYNFSGYKMAVVKDAEGIQIQFKTLGLSVRLKTRIEFLAVANPYVFENDCFVDLFSLETGQIEVQHYYCYRSQKELQAPPAHLNNTIHISATFDNLNLSRVLGLSPVEATHLLDTFRLYAERDGAFQLLRFNLRQIFAQESGRLWKLARIFCKSVATELLSRRDVEPVFYFSARKNQMTLLHLKCVGKDIVFDDKTSTAVVLDPLREADAKHRSSHGDFVFTLVNDEQARLGMLYNMVNGFIAHEPASAQETH